MGERALDTFEAITAVNNGLVPRDALPTGAIEPVIEIQHAEPSRAMQAAVEPTASSTEADDLLVAVDPALAAELAATVDRGVRADSAAAGGSAAVHSGVLTEAAGTIDAAVTAYSASAARTSDSVVATDRAVMPAAGTDPAAVVDVIAVESELSTRLTERMPELADEPPIARRFAERAPIAALPLRAAVTDKIARERGLPPISEPYVRERERVHVARGWFYAALALAIAALVASASVVMWARAEVRRARDAQQAPRSALAAANAASGAVEPSAPSAGAAPVLATPASAAVVDPPAPPSCSLRVTSTVDDAVVWIAGQRVGDVPAEASVPCGHETSVEVRRARYRSFKSAVAVPDGTVVVNARLERKRRRH